MVVDRRGRPLVLQVIVGRRGRPSVLSRSLHAVVLPLLETYESLLVASVVIEVPAVE